MATETQPTDRPVAYWYRCRACRTVMWTEHQAVAGNPYRCITCASYMRFLYTEALPADDVGKGIVWNPGHAEARAQTTPEERWAFRRYLREKAGRS